MTPSVCIVKVESPLDDKTVTLLMPFSPLEKQQRILRQRVKQKADMMIVGGALARHILWKTFCIPPGARIAYGEFGKPYLPDYPHAYFNISHSGSYVVCAVCDVPVGVDVQEIVCYRPDIANRVFNSSELEEIQRSSNLSFEFTRAWTQMEARMKAAGFRIGINQNSNVPMKYKMSSYLIGDAFLSISYKAR